MVKQSSLLSLYIGFWMIASIIILLIALPFLLLLVGLAAVFIALATLPTLCVCFLFLLLQLCIKILEKEYGLGQDSPLSAPDYYDRCEITNNSTY